LLESRQKLQDELIRQTGGMFRNCYNNGISVPEKQHQKFNSILQEWAEVRDNRSGNGHKSNSQDSKVHIQE